ncbi:hypothetical protein BAUCODRAFT_150370 [Baudoinia panamericana UAMH 10762]|uniref:Uncharacterized protein n=1 Tax=Baudoinia panamericana (strain UAMH 10762) TaxID=717646 RepID=M2N553_BAUPA|nr:uncharacterized protein BAUCODRAFT_150370 [Baudoinia panamericana UAMH 10762]EMC94164.1 hypothetical protein BAUCODRAFT_150370 [Baudoinia panamericana UAMH 10762]
MQSSPPVRAWKRPASPTDSHYSLDLGALEVDGRNNGDSPVAQKRVDRILSEDIDGPSDFTDNMMQWMQRGTMGRGTVRSAKHSMQRRLERGADGGANSGKQDNDLGLPLSPVENDNGTASHHTPDHSPPKDSPWHEQPPHINALSGADERQDSSDWDPYAPSGTPHPSAQNQILQPTVADYLTELTPAHAPSLRLTTRTLSQRRERSPQRSEPPSPARASSATLSPTRSPVMQRSQPVNVSSPFTEPEAHRQLVRETRQLQARCQQLQSLNSALKEALDEEQRVRRQEKAAFEVQQASVIRHEQDVEKVRMETLEQVASLRQVCGEQKNRIEELEAETRALRRKNEEFDARSNFINGELEQVKEEADSVHAKKAAADEATAALRIELEAARKDNDQTKQLASEETQRALQDASDLRKQINELGQQLRDEAIAHDDEVRKLETTQKRELAEAKADSDSARNELEANQSLFNDAVVDRDAAQDSLAALQSDLEAARGDLSTAHAEIGSLKQSSVVVGAEADALRAELELAAEVNAALDAKISNAIRKREKYWRSRLAESEQERQTMAKALLKQWGREEVGMEDPQAFEFRYHLRGCPKEAAV